MSTSMKVAFESVGYEPPEAKLLRLVIESIQRNPTNSNKIRSDILGASRNDQNLLWTLTKDVHGLAVESWVKRAREEMAKQRTTEFKVVEGQAAHETHLGNALNKAGTGSSGPGYASPKTITAGEFRKQFGAEAKDRAIKATCRLWTVMVNGKPIGDCTVGEVKEWASSQNDLARGALRDVRFARALISTLPSNAVIRDYWTDEGKVEALYESAEKHAAGLVPC